MKKFFIALVLRASCSFGGVQLPFKQFERSDYHESIRLDQNWMGAQMISLSVKANTGVWLSNYVSSWYAPILDLNGNIYDMRSSQYGYVTKENAEAHSTDYLDYVHWSNGYSLEITYFDDNNPYLTNSTNAYFLDYFDENKEIYLVMTTIPDDGSETVDSFQYVSDENHDTSLVSRVDGTVDAAKNIRVNFGINSNSLGFIGREFVAAYDGDMDYSQIRDYSTGGPLPGLLTACILSI